MKSIEYNQDTVAAPEKKWSKPVLMLAVIGIGIIALTAFAGLTGENKKTFYFTYLTSFMFYLSIALGGLFFVMLQHVTKAGWSVTSRRIGEGFMKNLLFMPILFIPIILGINELYDWTNVANISSKQMHLWEHKRPYLNTTFFLIRAAFYFIVWFVLARFMYNHSVKQDEDGENSHTLSMGKWSTIGIFLFAVTSTFAAFDWIMSLDFAWFSTMFGVVYFAGSVIAIFACIIISATILQKKGYCKDVITTEHFHDHGKMLFAFITFWGYTSFCEFMLYWYANVPEETLWYTHRWAHGWKLVSIILIVIHFILPFLMLMSRHVKRKRITLFIMAIWMLIAHYLHIYWMVMPNLNDGHFHLTWMDFTMPLGMGLLFIAGYINNMRNHKLIPVRDPRVNESLLFENF